MRRAWKRARIIRSALVLALGHERTDHRRSALGHKSTLAEKRAIESGLHVIYVATAQALDGGMEHRIKLHRERRPASWGLVESLLDLAKVLKEHAAPDVCLLVDCLTLWLSNMLFAGDAAKQAEAGQPVDCPCSGVKWRHWWKRCRSCRAGDHGFQRSRLASCRWRASRACLLTSRGGSISAWRQCVTR